jgi:hypothetical protein
LPLFFLSLNDLNTDVLYVSQPFPLATEINSLRAFPIEGKSSGMAAGAQSPKHLSPPAFMTILSAAVRLGAAVVNVQAVAGLLCVGNGICKIHVYIPFRDFSGITLPLTKE